MQDVGMAPAISEELASVLFNLHLNQFENLLTKNEFSKFDNEIKKEIDGVKSEMKNFVTKDEFSKFDNEIKKEIDGVKKEIDGIKNEMKNFVTKDEFSKFENEIKSEMKNFITKKEFYAETKNLSLNLTIKMGILMTAGISVLGLLIKL
jgi:hypothetical protein